LPSDLPAGQIILDYSLAVQNTVNTSYAASFTLSTFEITLLYQILSARALGQSIYQTGVTYTIEYNKKRTDTATVTATIAYTVIANIKQKIAYNSIFGFFVNLGISPIGK
jgi:hypothetical protein